jgi:hypothetical protein
MKYDRTWEQWGGVGGSRDAEWGPPLRHSIDVSITHDKATVRPELVEACHELAEWGLSEWAQGFDKAQPERQ